MTDKTDSKEREAQAAETWLRDRYGAYRGHFAWRELEEAFLAGRASLAVSAGSGPLMGKPQEMPDLSALTERGAKAWAGVDAQGLREGVASAGSEPVAYAMFADNGNIRLWSKARIPHPDAKPLYLHPSPPEGMVGGWVSVKERLPPPFEEVVVYPRPDDYCCEAFCDTAGKWKWAEYEHNFGVHHRGCQVEYWLMLPEVPAPPTSSADSRKGE